MWLVPGGLALLLATASGAPSGVELVERSIAHHDPEGRWASGVIELTVETGLSERLARERGYESRSDRITIDNAAGGFRYHSRRGDQEIAVVGRGDDFEARFNGEIEIAAADRERYGLAPDRLPGWRDYFTYVFGLPMKLRDPGTRIDPAVVPAQFAGHDTWRVRVTYDEEVGGDTWYLYFDPDTAALRGARFYRDEAANDGEFIVYEGEVTGAAGLRLPRVHRWHMNRDDEWIATDEVMLLREPGPPGSSLEG